MSQKNYKERIEQELKVFFLNLKAEVIIAELLENSSLEIEDIQISQKSTFSRAYRRDLMRAKINPYKKLEATLSRNGLYDALPQGIFHKSVGIDTKLTYSEIRQKNKKEEKDARDFFTPLENEFFLHKVFLEQKEKETIFELSNNVNHSFIVDFWGLKNKVPNQYIFSLVKVLPLAHKISNNETLIALCLEEILNEKVVINKEFKPLKNAKDSNNKDAILGINSSLAIKQTRVFFPFFTISIEINDIKNRTKFQNKGDGLKLVEVFCEYFIPLEVEWEIKVSFNQKEIDFSLNKESAILGLSATI